MENASRWFRKWRFVGEQEVNLYFYNAYHDHYFVWNYQLESLLAQNKLERWLLPFCMVGLSVLDRWTANQFSSSVAHGES
jgi:hypothetical protein